MSTFRDIAVRFFPVPAYIDRLYPALDISQSSIKMIVADRRGAYLIPRLFEERLLPVGAIEEGAIHDEQALIQELMVLKKKVPFTHAIVSLPEEYAYIFPVRVQGKSDLEIKTEVEFALSEHVPIPLPFVVYTYEMVEDTLVSVIAYDARVSGSYEQVLSFAQITPVAFVPHIVASARVSRVEALRSHYVVDIGRTRTSVAFVYAGHVLASATIYAGSKGFEEKLLSSGLSAEDATIAIQTAGVHHPALHAAWADFTHALLPYIELWHTGQFGESIVLAAPREVYVCGAFAATPGVCDALEQALHMSVRTMAVWERLFPIETYVPRIHARDAFRYTAASGLLLSNL
jgi:Tfp pilus assembly PilM family ATPase